MMLRKPVNLQSRLEYQIATATEALMRLNRIPDLEKYEEDSVIMWKKVFDSNPDKAYSYVAVKCGGRWYTTAAREPRVYYSDDLRELLSRPDVREIWIVGEWLPVGDPK